MERISATDFKEQCLSLLDEVGPEGIVITKHGKAVAKLMPVLGDSGRLIGALKGRLEIRGDILSTGLAWDAVTEPEGKPPPATVKRNSKRGRTAGRRDQRR